MGNWGTLKRMTGQAMERGGRGGASYECQAGDRIEQVLTSVVLLKSSASFEATNRLLSLNMKGI